MTAERKARRAYPPAERARLCERKARRAYPISSACLLACVLAGCMGELFPNAGTQCVTNKSLETTVSTPADPPTQFQIERCRVDVDACPDLCAITLATHQGGTQTSCTVRFHDNGDVDVKVGFQQFNDGPFCAQPGIEDIGSGAGK